ncbi:MAG: NAD(P)/FAD-dependent oxidoreductase, partial [Bacteroidota bacterium]
IYPFRKRFSGQKDFYFRLGEVCKIHPADNLIETSIGMVRYDYLVIATGTQANFYGMEDIQKHAVPLKRIEDAIQLRNKIIRNFEAALLTDDPVVKNSLIDFVIVGGGPTGVEVAGALAELKRHVFPQDYPELDLMEMDIDLVEAGPRLLAGMSEEAGLKSQKFLETLGVKVHLNALVKSFDGYKVTLGTGKEIISQTLVWAAGVTGAPIPGLPEETRGRANRIKVDDYNRVVGFDNIFAIGDIALMESESYPKGHPQVAQPAIQQGKLLAHNLKKILQNQSLKPFKYKDKGSMATIGRNKAVVDIGQFRSQGFLAWFLWMFVHLMALVGFRNRILVFINWVWSYFSYDKSNRLIIDPKVPEALSEKETA